jgi:hypothetical protein
MKEFNLIDWSRSVIDKLMELGQPNERFSISIDLNLNATECKGIDQVTINVFKVFEYTDQDKFIYLSSSQHTLEKCIKGIDKQLVKKIKNKVEIDLRNKLSGFIKG